MNLSAPFALIAGSLGWAVVNSLWQITAIYLIFKVLSWLFRGRHLLIYRFSLLAMLGAAFWFIQTFAAEHERLSGDFSGVYTLETPGIRTIHTVEIFETQHNAPTLTEKLGYWLDDHAAQVGSVWALCVLLLWIRLIGGWWLLRRLRRRDIQAPPADAIAQCRRLADALGIKPLVKLLESPHVNEPLTLGFWKPVILFPAGMLLRLSPAQVEALMLHELAHIRRYDYLVNLFQVALETCFFYHPLFRFISLDARVRREFCCDDIVLQRTGDPILYAKTLTDLQLSFLYPATQLTMNATGKSRFTERILRIAGISQQGKSRPNWMIVIILPVTITLASWWPSQATPAMPDAGITETVINPNDTLPPRMNPAPTPVAKRSTVEPKAASVNDDAPAPAVASPKVAMELVKMNVFYIGIDNPVQVAVEGVPGNELKLRLEGPGAISGGDGNYNVVVSKPGEITITILRLVNGAETEIGRKKYRVKRIPDPAPVLEGTYKIREDDPMVLQLNPHLKSMTDTLPGIFKAKGGFITKEKLLVLKNVEAMMASFDFDAGCVVSDYKITVAPAKGDPVAFHVVGQAIPANIREYFEKLEGNGDTVYFDDIKVKCPGDMMVRNIGSVIFKISPEITRQ